MRPYLAVVGARFQVLLQYRAAAAAGAVTQVFWGFMRVMIFAAFYASSTASHPMRFSEVVTYIWLGQAFFTLLPWRLDYELLAQFRSGDVAFELLRPIDLYAHWYARFVANLTAPALLRCIPVLLIATCLSDFGLPASWAAALAWALATLGAVALGAAMLTTLTMTCFWTIAGEGVAALHMAAFFFLSGMSIPLPLFPPWLRDAIAFLPYSGFVDTPFRLYMGHLPPSAVGGVLAHQLLWTLALIAAGKLLLRRGARRLVLQGG